MKFTNAQIAACQRELERTAGRKWVSYAAIPQAAHNAFSEIGWGCDDGPYGTDLFTDRGVLGNQVDGNEVALASAWVLALAGAVFVSEGQR